MPKDTANKAMFAQLVTLMMLKEQTLALDATNMEKPSASMWHSYVRPGMEAQHVALTGLIQQIGGLRSALYAQNAYRPPIANHAEQPANPLEIATGLAQFAALYEDQEGMRDRIKSLAAYLQVPFVPLPKEEAARWKALQNAASGVKSKSRT